MNSSYFQNPSEVQMSYTYICQQNKLLNIEVLRLNGQISLMTNNYAQMETQCKNLQEENKKLRDEIDQIKNSNEKLKIDIEKKRSYYFKYIRQIKEINKLKCQIESLEKKEQKFKDRYIIDSKTITCESMYDSTEYLLFKKNNDEMFNLFICELIENAKVSIYGRKYSDFYKTICLGLFFTNTNAYKALQKIIPVPPITTLYYFSRKNLTEYKTCIQNLNEINFLFEEFRKTYFEDRFDVIYCSLAIDQTVGIKSPMFYNNHKKNNYLCLYYLQPINNFYSCTPIYIEFNLNGRMSDKTLQNSKIICENAKKNGFLIKYICTDADTPTNKWHKSIINKKYNPIIQNLFDAINNIPEPSFSTDFLHALKSQKKRFFKCDLYLNIHSQKINKYVVRMYLIRTLGKNKVFNDESLQSSFKDSYALDFFCPKVLYQSLKQKETISFAYYILPFTFWYMGDKSLYIGRNDRLNLLNVAYSIFQFELQNFPEKNSEEHFSTKKTKNTLKLSFYRKIDLIRYLNSIVCLADSIKNSSENVGTERVSSHGEENFFGNTREELNNSLDADLFLSVIARNIIRKKILFKNHIVKNKTFKEKRKNIAGVPTLTNIDDIEIDLAKIIDECFYIRKFVTQEIDTFSEDKIPEILLTLMVLNDKPYLLSEKSFFSAQKESYTSGAQLLSRFNMIKNKRYFSQPNEY